MERSFYYSCTGTQRGKSLKPTVSPWTGTKNSQNNFHTFYSARGRIDLYSAYIHFDGLFRLLGREWTGDFRVHCVRLYWIYAEKWNIADPTISPNAIYEARIPGTGPRSRSLWSGKWTFIGLALLLRCMKKGIFKNHEWTNIDQGPFLFHSSLHK